MGDEEDHDGKEEQAPDDGELRLSDPERDRQVEHDDPEVDERLQEPAPPDVTDARGAPDGPSLEELEDGDGRERDEEPARIVAERHAEVHPARRVVIDTAEEPPLAADGDGIDHEV